MRSAQLDIAVDGALIHTSVHVCMDKYISSPTSKQRLPVEWSRMARVK